LNLGKNDNFKLKMGIAAGGRSILHIGT